MITRKLHITSIDDASLILERCKQYSYAFRLLYKMIDESSDTAFIERFKERFDLTDIDYRSLVAMVKARRSAWDARNEEISTRIADLEYTLSEDSSMSNRKRYRLLNKVAYLRKSLDYNIVFGGRRLLADITREYNKGESRDGNRLSSLISEYREKRIMAFSVMGEGNQKGNRFFDLSGISEGRIVYKPKKGVRVRITFKVPKKFQREMLSLQEAAMGNALPVTVSVGREWIYFSFDEERLNGYAVDEVSRRADVREVKRLRLPKESEAERIKEIYRRYYEERDRKRMEGKIEGRCISVDLNPTNIGYSVLDRTDDGEAEVVSCGWIDLSEVCRNLHVASGSREQEWQTNKRRYEISMVVKYLFRIAEHYGCSKFIMEDLDIDRAERTGEGSTEFRRKVNLLWNRTLLEGIVMRRCNQTGIDLVRVNPAYTSFIGNMRHPYVDATNASIEIGRRGLHMYTKGAFYPVMDAGSLSTVEAAKFGADVSGETHPSWPELRKSLRGRCESDAVFEHRLRTALDEIPNELYLRFSMFSYNSKIICITFN